MADEEDQLPALGIVVGCAPGGHTGPADAVVNDVVELAIGQLLGFGFTHVRGAGVEVASHLGVAAAVVGVAGGAVVGEVAGGFLQYFGRGSLGIFLIAGVARHG